MGDAYMVEPAKSGRSACKVSKEIIEKGELRFGSKVDIGGHATYHWRKLAYITGKQVENVASKMGGVEGVAGWDALNLKQQTMLRRAFGKAKQAGEKVDKEKQKVAKAKAKAKAAKEKAKAAKTKAKAKALAAKAKGKAKAKAKAKGNNVSAAADAARADTNKTEAGDADTGEEALDAAAAEKPRAIGVPRPQRGRRKIGKLSADLSKGEAEFQPEILAPGANLPGNDFDGAERSESTKNDDCAEQRATLKKRPAGCSRDGEDAATAEAERDHPLKKRPAAADAAPPQESNPQEALPIPRRVARKPAAQVDARAQIQVNPGPSAAAASDRLLRRSASGARTADVTAFDAAESVTIRQLRVEEWKRKAAEDSGPTTGSEPACASENDLPVQKAGQLQVDVAAGTLVVHVFGSVLSLKVSDVQSMTQSQDASGSLLQVRLKRQLGRGQLTSLQFCGAPGHSFDDLLRSFREVQAREGTSDAPGSSSLVEGSLATLESPPRLSHLKLFPAMLGGQRAWTLEAHSNGFRFSVQDSDEKVDILYSQIKHALHEISTDRPPFLHLHLGAPVTVPQMRRPLTDIQCVAESAQVAELSDFLKNVEHIEACALRFDLTKELAFEGMRAQRLSAHHCYGGVLTELATWPGPVVVDLSEVDVAIFEQMGGSREASLVLIFKDFRRRFPFRCDGVGTSYLPGLKRWLLRFKVPWFTVPAREDWRKMARTIQDLREFAAKGGWAGFLHDHLVFAAEEADTQGHPNSEQNGESDAKAQPDKEDDFEEPPEGEQSPKSKKLRAQR